MKREKELSIVGIEKVGEREKSVDGVLGGVVQHRNNNRGLGNIASAGCMQER